MTDLSLVDDDDIELGGDDDGEGHETEGAADGDEGQEGDADEGQEGDADEGQDENVAEESAPRRTRSNDRVRRLAAERKAEKERADRLEREIAEIRQQRQQGPSPEEIRQREAIEAERLSLMTPEERADYRVAQAEHRMEQRFRQTEMRLAQESDKSAFRSLQATDPLARKYAAEVERVVEEQLRQGYIVTRERALNYVIGEAMRRRASSETPKQRKAAQSRISAASSRPGRPGGEAVADRGRGRGDDSEAALERRLAGKIF